MKTESLFGIANFFYLVGTILLARKVMKNRNALKDFDFYGSVTNVIGMTITAYTFVKLMSYTAAIISIPTMLFWAMAAVYSFKNRRAKNDK